MNHDVTAVVLTRNASRTLEECLKRLSFCDKLLIVDDGSTDATETIVRSFNARFVKHARTSFADQRNFALSLVSTKWSLFVDSDEMVSKALQEEIIDAIVQIKT